MGTKIMKKGLLTPIKYITKIFDAKEPELQIGMPTDVKHVGHIGYDGPNASGGPTWLNQFHSAPLNDPTSPASSTTNPWASQDLSIHSTLTDSPLRDAQITDSPRSKPRHSRRYQSEGTTIPVESSDPSLKKKGRKVRKKEGSGENSSRMIPDLPTIPKKSKKKSKDGSVKPRRKEAVVAPEEAIVESEKPVEEELIEGALM